MDSCREKRKKRGSNLTPITVFTTCKIVNHKKKMKEGEKKGEVKEDEEGGVKEDEEGEVRRAR